MSIYPQNIDTFASLPLVNDKQALVTSDFYNRLRNAVVKIEKELGIQPKNTFADVNTRISAYEMAFSRLPFYVEENKLIIKDSFFISVGQTIIPTESLHINGNLYLESGSFFLTTKDNTKNINIVLDDNKDGIYIEGKTTGFGVPVIEEKLFFSRNDFDIGKKTYSTNSFEGITSIVSQTINNSKGTGVISATDTMVGNFAGQYISQGDTTGTNVGIFTEGTNGTLNVGVLSRATGQNNNIGIISASINGENNVGVLSITTTNDSQPILTENANILVINSLDIPDIKIKKQQSSSDISFCGEQLLINNNNISKYDFFESDVLSDGYVVDIQDNRIVLALDSFFGISALNRSTYKDVISNQYKQMTPVITSGLCYIYCNSENGVISKGDLLQLSSTSGILKKKNTNAFSSNTVAKAIEGISDGSTKKILCKLY